MVKRKLINGDHDLSKPGICLVLRNFKYRQLSYPIDIKEKIKSKFERKEGINVSKSCRKVFLKLLELNDEIELSKKDEYKDIHIKFEEAWNLLEEKVIEKVGRAFGIGVATAVTIGIIPASEVIIPALNLEQSFLLRMSLGFSAGIMSGVFGYAFGRDPIGKSIANRMIPLPPKYFTNR